MIGSKSKYSHAKHSVYGKLLYGMENANGIIHHSEGIDRHAKLLLLKSLTDVISKT